MIKEIDKAMDLFSELLAVPAPSGREEAIADLVRSKLDTWHIGHETDGAGNVIVRLEGREATGPRICYAAHMDEIGMVVTSIRADGGLNVDRSGGLFPWKIGERPVEVIGDHGSITGVLSMGSTHTPDAGEKQIGWADVQIITGLSPAQLADAGIRPGSTAVPSRAGCGPVTFGDPADPLVGAWTFDDRMGVVALLRLLQSLKAQGKRPRYSTIVAFTVHEEGGAHGAKALAHAESPDILVAIDGLPMPPAAALTLDDRPGIWSKDAVAHYDQRLVRAFMAAAQEAGTALQPAVFARAASDASLAYATGAVHRIACLGHPRENSHGYEVARLSVFDNLLHTLLQFVVETDLAA